MWKKEVARDLLALGSIPFYLIVIARTIVGAFEPFLFQLVFGLIIVTFFTHFTKANTHLARGLILLVFISAFYAHLLFTIMAVILYICMVLAAHYLKKPLVEIYSGVVLALSALALLMFFLCF